MTKLKKRRPYEVEIHRIIFSAPFLSFKYRLSKKTVTNDGKAISVEEGKDGIPSVCIWDKASVKSEPTQKGAFVSSMALGEKVICLGEDKVDPADKNRKYYKIRLSDGKEGWASEYSLAIDAKPSVAIQRTMIYLRPDLVTVTDKEFSSMEFIAVSKTENEWCEARGQEGKKKGWIKANSVTTKDDDITVALLGLKALTETNKDKRKEKIDAIVNNPSFANSIFIDSLKNNSESKPSAADGGASVQEPAIK